MCCADLIRCTIESLQITKSTQICDKPVSEMVVVSEVLHQDRWPLVKRQPVLATANAPIHTQNLPLFFCNFFFPDKFSVDVQRVRLIDFDDVVPTNRAN